MLKNICLAALLGLLTFPFLGLADSQTRARALVNTGEILPLQSILEKAESEVHGKVIEVELHERANQLFYEIEWLDDHGNVWEYEFDAKSGKLLNKRLDD